MGNPFGQQQNGIFFFVFSTTELPHKKPKKPSHWFADIEQITNRYRVNWLTKTRTMFFKPLNKCIITFFWDKTSQRGFRWDGKLSKGPHERFYNPMMWPWLEIFLGPCKELTPYVWNEQKPISQMIRKKCEGVKPIIPKKEICPPVTGLPAIKLKWNWYTIHTLCENGREPMVRNRQKVALAPAAKAA